MPNFCPLEDVMKMIYDNVNMPEGDEMFCEIQVQSCH